MTQAISAVWALFKLPVWLLPMPGQQGRCCSQARPWLTDHQLESRSNLTAESGSETGYRPGLSLGPVQIASLALATAWPARTCQWRGLMIEENSWVKRTYQWRRSNSVQWLCIQSSWNQVLSIKNHPFQFSLLLHLEVFQSVGEKFL